MPQCRRNSAAGEVCDYRLKRRGRRGYGDTVALAKTGLAQLSQRKFIHLGDDKQVAWAYPYDTPKGDTVLSP